jgi:hypothetical protein
MVFVGRKKELAYLEEKYASDRSEFLLIYGRRRLGKTRLIKESLKQKKGVYYLLTQESSTKNLDDFKEYLGQEVNPLIGRMQIKDWVDFFSSIIDLLPENFIIALDEFPYLVSQGASILSQFQKIYDEYLKKKNIKLVLCGSSLSVMSDMMSYDSPLYGRRTGSIRLNPFTFYEAKQYFKKVDDLNIIMRYHLIFGGVPYYFEQVDQSIEFAENIKKLFFGTTTIFADELSFLLKQEFREVRYYLSILKSIAQGKTTFSEIVDATGVDKSTISTYLSNLELLGMIRMMKPFFAKRNTKKTRYRISDNYLYFWLHAIERFRNQLQNKSIQQKILSQSIPSALGYLFEQECMRILSSHYDEVGTHFDGAVEIDIIAKKGTTFHCFECKFSKDIDERRILHSLNEKMNALPENNYKSYIISIDQGIDLKRLLQMAK